MTKYPIIRVSKELLEELERVRRATGSKSIVEASRKMAKAVNRSGIAKRLDKEELRFKLKI